MDVFKMLAAILHLGNVEIAAVGDERSSISVRKQLVQIPTFPILFYARSALAIVSLISGAQSSIKSGVLNLIDFCISICVESQQVFTQMLFCAQVQKLLKGKMWLRVPHIQLIHSCWKIHFGTLCRMQETEHSQSCSECVPASYASLKGKNT